LSRLLHLYVIGGWEKRSGLPAVQLNTDCKRTKSKQTMAFREPCCLPCLKGALKNPFPSLF